MWQKQFMIKACALGFSSLMLPLSTWFLILGAPVSAQVSVDQATPMEITTDTPEYCQKLFRRVSDLVRLATEPVPHEVADLTTEGERMCDSGQTRGGIMRLRSALMLMERGNGPAYR